MKKSVRVASASIKIKADAERIWQSLVDPAEIKKYMFGTDVEAQWEVGGQILWKGQWQGKSFIDKGKILELDKPNVLTFSYFSALSGLEDKPENYNTVRFEIDSTQELEIQKLTITQDNIADEEKQKDSEKNWNFILNTIKGLIET